MKKVLLVAALGLFLVPVAFASSGDYSAPAPAPCTVGCTDASGGSVWVNLSGYSKAFGNQTQAYSGGQYVGAFTQGTTDNGIKFDVIGGYLGDSAGKGFSEAGGISQFSGSWGQESWGTKW